MNEEMNLDILLNEMNLDLRLMVFRPKFTSDVNPLDEFSVSDGNPSSNFLYCKVLSESYMLGWDGNDIAQVVENRMLQDGIILFLVVNNIEKYWE